MSNAPSLDEGKEILVHSEDLLQRSLYKECVEQAQVAQEIFSAAGDLDREAEAIRVGIVAKADQGEHDEQTSPDEIDLLCEIELGRFRACGSRHAVAILLYTLAECNVSRPTPLMKPAAHQWCLEARQIFLELGEKSWEGRAVLHLVNVLHKLNKAEKMHQYAQEALKIFEETGDRKRQGMALHASCLAYLGVQDWAAAVEKGLEALAIYRDVGDRRLEIAQLKTIAMWRLQLDGNHGLIAAREAMEALELSRRYTEPNQESTVLQTALQALLAIGEQNEAIKQANISLKRLEADPKMHLEVITLKLLISDMEGKDPSEEAEMLGAIKSKRQKLDVLLDVGKTQMQRQNLDGAELSFWQAGQLAREMGKTQKEAAATLQLAQCILLKGHPSKAISLAKKAQTLSQSIGDREGEAETWTVLACAHNVGKRRDLAHMCLREAQVIYEESGSYLKEADVWKTVAEFHLEAQHLESALQAAAKRLEVIQKNNGKVKEQVESLELLSHLFLSMGNVKESERSATEMLRLAKLNPSQKSLEITAHLTLVHVYVFEMSIAPEKAKAGMRMKPLKSAEQAWALASKSNVRIAYKASARYMHAEALICAGRAPQALAAAREAEGYFTNPQVRDPYGECKSLCLQAGMTSMHLGQLDEAKKLAEKGLKLAQDIGFQKGEEMAKAELQRLKDPDLLRPKGKAQGRRGQQRAAPAPKAEKQADAPSTVSAGLDPQMVKAKLMASLQSVVADEDQMVDAESAFMDIGMDSLTAIDLQNLIAKDFPFANPSSTVLFDFPNIRELTEHIVDESKRAGI